MTQEARRAHAALPTKFSGDQAEARACRHLEKHGLQLIAKNYRTPGRGGGEIDLIMRQTDGTLVFVEVRSRSASSHGGAAASITPTKIRRIIFAARHYLMRLPQTPPCRFDVVAIEEDHLNWIQGAFDAHG
ncbi:MAG: YraN family protein [Betaproteobacteria bacterium]|nr:YraN family protein [Betaproteobacteria bacterium]